MLIGKVIGNVWATRKSDFLNGYKLMSVELITEPTKKLVVVDVLSAGVGDKVVIATGSSARRMLERDNIPVDAVIVGIIDKECNTD